MNKIALLLTIISICLPMAKSQDLAIDKAYNDILQVRQIPNTNEKISLFFKDYVSSDTIFAIVNPVANCPRCESMISPLVKTLSDFRKDVPVVLVQVYDDSCASKKYLERYDLMTPNTLFDTSSSCLEFLSFSAGYLHIPYLLKIAIHSGEIIIGVPADDGSEQFIKDFCDLSVPIEKKTYQLNSLTKGLFKEPKEKLAIRTKYKLCIPDSISLSQSDYLPEFEKDKLFFNDKLNESIAYFKIHNREDSILKFVKQIRTTELQNKEFIKIPDSIYEASKDMIRCMPMAPKVLNDTSIIIPYSLPYIWFTGPSSIGYRNKSCFLKTNPDTNGAGEVIPFTHDNNPDFYYPHFNINILRNNIAIGCERLTWPVDIDKEDYCDDPNTNPFDERYYKIQQPISAIFDSKTGVIKKRIGNLPSLSKETLTGSYFVSPKIDTWGDQIAMTDGFSGEILILDSLDFSIKEKLHIFTIPDDIIPKPNPSFFYSYDCVADYIDIFNRNIEDIKISKDFIYCLIRYGKHGEPSKEDMYTVARVGLDCDCVEEKTFPSTTNPHKYFGLRRTSEGEIHPYVLSKLIDSSTWEIYEFEF